MSALKEQVGGDHYRTMAIQPVEFIKANDLGFLEGTALKYIVRHKIKGQSEDILKAIHTLTLLLELEYKRKVKVMEESKHKPTP